MRDVLVKIMMDIYRVHEHILKLNDKYEVYFSDKQLHFIVMGLLGMALVFIVHPLFLYLAKRKKILTITWIYVFTLILVITFAIEIGQKITKTGVMDFYDIVFGVFGFFFMFGVFAFVRGIIILIGRLITYISKKGDVE